MARARKDALEKTDSLVFRVEQHLAKIIANPDHQSRSHWKDETHTWLRTMEAQLRHVGKKTSAQWQARISNWRALLGD